MKLSKEQLKGIFRHILTAIGGILVAKGILDESMLSELIGSITTIIGVVWSVKDKKKKLNDK